MRNRMRRRRRRRMRRRRRTSVNPRLIDDIEVHPPSKTLLHRPLQRLISTDGIAPLGDNRVNTLKRAKTPFSGLRRHMLTG
eukprot:4053652-Pyramimonas_sp.AAC.1